MRSGFSPATPERSRFGWCERACQWCWMRPPAPETAQPEPADAGEARVRPMAVAHRTPLLDVRDLTVMFGPVRALDAVELHLGTGELVVLTGEPGAGKTTLVRCLAGNVTPSSGEIRLKDRPIRSGSVAAERVGIGVVWQDLE